MLTLKKHTTADGVGASHACCLLLLPFKATHTFSIFNCLFEKKKKPLFMLRPKKPKMPMSVLMCLAKETGNDTAKACLLSLPYHPPLYTHWWYFRGCQTEHYIGILSVRTWRDFFHIIQFLPCVSQLTQSYKEWNVEGDFITHLS